MSDAVEPLDQPPGVDTEVGPFLPPADEAARRVLEYVGAFGDGLIDGGHRRPPLYARDLESVATEVERLRAALTTARRDALTEAADYLDRLMRPETRAADLLRARAAQEEDR